ncbi:MAG: Secretion system C-terminal sorting domain [Bacteroidota bacterium]
MKEFLSSFVSVLFLSACAFAQNVYVHTTDMATHAYPLIDVKSIVFEDNVMHLNLITGETVAWNISVVRYYDYDQWYVSVPDGMLLEKEGIVVYPNPTLGDVAIEFKLAYEAQADVSVYTIDGSRVETLHNGRLAAGGHGMVWNTLQSKVSNGTYVCRVQIGHNVFHKLIIVNR